MSDDNKKQKGGRPRGSKNKTALVRLDKAAAAIAPQVSALKAEDKLYTHWTRRIQLCGRFPYRPTIGGACGMYRPSIGCFLLSSDIDFST